jgi:hypothetical protein
MARLQLGGQATRGFGDDLKATRQSVKRPHVGQAELVIKPSTKELARSMLKSYRKAFREPRPTLGPDFCIKKLLSV